MAESSKFNAYVVTDIAGLETSKMNAYAVTDTSTNAECTKLNAYAVIDEGVSLGTAAVNFMMFF